MQSIHILYHSKFPYFHSFTLNGKTEIIFPIFDATLKPPFRCKPFMKKIVFIAALALQTSTTLGQLPELFLLYKDSVSYYMSKQNITASLRCADKILGFYPSNVNGYVLKAEVLDRAKRYEEALVVLRTLRTLQPTFPETYIRQALVHYKLMQTDSSIIDLTQALGGGRYFDSTAFRLRGFIYHDLHRYEEAMHDLDSALRYKPMDREFYVMRARVQFALNKPLEAASEVNRAFKFPTTPRLTNADLYSYRAVYYLSAKELDQALSDCEASLKLNQNNIPCLFIKGQILLSKKRFNDAVDCFNECAQKKLKDVNLYFMRGMASYYLAHNEAAIADFMKYLEVDTSNPQVYYFIGICKNDMKPNSGCDYLRKSHSLGFKPAASMLDEQCK